MKKLASLIGGLALSMGIGCDSSVRYTPHESDTRSQNSASLSLPEIESRINEIRERISGYEINIEYALSNQELIRLCRSGGYDCLTALMFLRESDWNVSALHERCGREPYMKAAELGDPPQIFVYCTSEQYENAERLGEELLHLKRARDAINQ